MMLCSLEQNCNKIHNKHPAGQESVQLAHLTNLPMQTEGDSLLTSVNVAASLDQKAHSSSRVSKTTSPGHNHLNVGGSGVNVAPIEINKKLKKRHESTMSVVTGRMRKVPSIFTTKPDKSVQFAQENTILIIDDDNQLIANG